MTSLITPPSGTPRAAVLLLHGSSGRPDMTRARLLAGHGAAVLVPRWFGGTGQPAGICEFPLEYFIAAVGKLAALYPATPIGIAGISKGAEAALLTAVHDPRVSSVVALAPTSVTWANVGPGPDGTAFPRRSSWTLNGLPLPFVPYDEDWKPAELAGPVAYRTHYESSLVTHAGRVPAATITVERITGSVLLVHGGDDQVWPADVFAAAIRARRREHGLPTTVVSEPSAGHQPVFSGETPPAPSRLARGGTPEADRRLGAAAWPEILTALGLAT
ncbi:acyl-CoA thioester hydrolase/BAAT C-terminal domain-containing protein [Longispora albida]|uniref:acyl-CoA thioester hydrolase/BAAT C-terminal domain-containing protein n=1 Tax=Longispora albida TaxID=203523 RepID=UPI0006844A68|nr:acyl-CoA thioester hydrolase/BAAT C-terminal domain-containing protein [Longispora albida]